MEGDCFANDYALGWTEEAGDDADGGEDGIEVPNLGGENEQEAECSADEIARDQGRFQGPSVDEDTGEDPEHRDWNLVGDLDARDLLGGGVELVGEQADDGEESEEVAKVRNDLGIPEAAHDGNAEDLAHGQGGWRGSGGRGLGLSAHGEFIVTKGGFGVGSYGVKRAYPWSDLVETQIRCGNGRQRDKGYRKRSRFPSGMTDKKLGRKPTIKQRQR